MPVLLMRIEVADFGRWNQIFDEGAGTRHANGSHSWRIFRNGFDPEEVWVLLEWDDLMRARLFANSDEMIDELIRAGVSSHPDYWFLDEAKTLEL